MELNEYTDIEIVDEYNSRCLYGDGYVDITCVSDQDLLNELESRELVNDSFNEEFNELALIYKLKSVEAFNTACAKFISDKLGIIL